MSKRVWRLTYVPEITPSAHGGYMAVCTELGLAASGETEASARHRLREIVETFGSTLSRQGMLEKAISESGIDAGEALIDLAEGADYCDVEPEVTR